MKRYPILVLAVLALGLLIWWGSGQWLFPAQDHIKVGNRPDLPTLTFYTTGLATTPQLPLWAAIARGELKDLCNLEVRQWKDVDDLRGVILAGKGDLWLGHTEGFAQAARQGAPVSILVISGWRKLYLVTREQGCTSLAHFAGRTLAVAPVGSPAVPILQALWPRESPPITFVAQDPNQLALSFMRGKVGSALVPEPLVTVLLDKVPHLKVVQNMEEVYGRLTGGPPRIPLAGLAVNTRTAERHPALMKKLVQVLKENARRLDEDSEPGIKSLPASFAQFISPDMVRRSLTRDLILVEPACGVQKEIATFLGMIYPPAVDGQGRLNLGEKFLWPLCAP